MRNLKKFLALVLAMVMAFSLMVTAHAENPKTDYPDMDTVLPEFEEAVDVLSGMGVFRGNNGQFLPQNKIMRCEAVAILYRLVTHDVDDTQVALYAPLATYFNDVKATDWFAPYVGFAVDAGYIKGYNGNFNPYSNVTGYEMLAMLLRAVGYGKNGEFTGMGWQINVGALAESLGILVDIESTHYADTLSQPSPREVVADLTFQVAAYVPTVRYEYGHYNKYIGVASAQGGNYLNLTLGEREFGLHPAYGVVVGNQATGENRTLLGQGFSSSGTAAEPVRDKWGYPVKVYTYTDDNGDLQTVYVYRFKNDDTLNPLYDKGSIIVTVADGKEAAEEADDGTTETCDIGVYTTGGSAGGSGDKYAYQGSMKFAYNTGLDLFGHQATVWYDWNSSSSGYTTYALIDEATWVKPVYAEDAKLSEDSAKNDPTKALLGRAAQAAGFSVDLNKSKAHFSDRFSQMGTSTAANGTDNASPIRTYLLISNSGNKQVDVVIALSAVVGQIAEKNTTAATQYLTLGDNVANTAATNKFGNGTGVNADRIFLDNLTPDTKEEQRQVGELVTAYQIVGTGFTLADAASDAGITTDDDWAEVQYQLDPMKYRDITVATYFAPNAATTPTTVTIDSFDNVIISVTPAGEDAVQMSGITWGDGTNSKIISKALPIPVNETTATAGEIIITAGMTYRLFEDLVGRFISLIEVPTAKFIYGTYAGYNVDGYDAGSSKYNLVGVDLDSKIQSDNPIKSYNSTPIDGSEYNKLTVTKLDQGVTTVVDGGAGNEIHAGYDTGYMYNSATGDVSATLTGITAMAATSWNFDSADAAHGFKKVSSGGVDYLVTNDTEFIIVTGTGTATLKVETAKGITGLLAGGTSADITHTTYATGAVKGTDNMVYFQTDVDVFGTAYVNNNRTIQKVILADGNLTRWNAQQLYYNFDQADATGVHLTGAEPSNPNQSGASVEQYALWNNGKLGYYFIDTSVSTQVPAAPGTPGTTWTATNDVETQTFYTLSPITEVSGVTVYKAVALADPAKVDYTTGHNSKSGGNEVTYQYVTVNNLSTGLLEKDGDQLVYSIDPDVIVCDVQYKVSPVTVSATRNEITNIRQLNDAVSVKLTNPGTFGYVDIEVAVVYEGSVITCIYVVNVPALST